MENPINRKKQFSTAVSAQLVKFMSGTAGIDEKLLHQLVWQSSKKLVKKYHETVEEKNDE